MPLLEPLAISPGLLDYIAPYDLAKLCLASKELHTCCADEKVWQQHSLELNHNYFLPSQSPTTLTVARYMATTHGLLCRCDFPTMSWQGFFGMLVHKRNWLNIARERSRAVRKIESAEFGDNELDYFGSLEDEERFESPFQAPSPNRRTHLLEGNSGAPAITLRDGRQSAWGDPSPPLPHMSSLDIQTPPISNGPSPMLVGCLKPGIEPKKQIVFSLDLEQAARKLLKFLTWIDSAFLPPRGSEARRVSVAKACERFKLLAQMRRLDTEEKVMEGMGMQGDWNDNVSDDFDPREGFGEEQCIEPRQSLESMDDEIIMNKRPLSINTDSLEDAARHPSRRSSMSVKYEWTRVVPPPDVELAWIVCALRPMECSESQEVSEPEMPHTSIAWADGLPEDTLSLLEDYEESLSWWGDQQSRLQDAPELIQSPLRHSAQSSYSEPYIVPNDVTQTPQYASILQRIQRLDDLRAELKGLRERPYSLDFGLESGFAAEGIEDEICDLEDWTRGSVVPTQVEQLLTWLTNFYESYDTNSPEELLSKVDFAKGLCEYEELWKAMSISISKEDLIGPGPPLEFVPTSYECDLMWHAHLVHELHYRWDCRRLLGEVVSHDPLVKEATYGAWPWYQLSRWCAEQREQRLSTRGSTHSEQDEYDTAERMLRLRESFPNTHDQLHLNVSQGWDQEAQQELAARKALLISKQQLLLQEKMRHKTMPEGGAKDASKSRLRMLKREVVEMDNELAFATKSYKSLSP